MQILSRLHTDFYISKIDLKSPHENPDPFSFSIDTNKNLLWPFYVYLGKWTSESYFYKS